MHMALIAHIECLFPASHLKSGSGASRLLQLSLFLDPWFSQARLDMQSKSCSISCLSSPAWTCLEGRPDQVPTTSQLAFVALGQYKLFKSSVRLRFLCSHLLQEPDSHHLCPKSRPNSLDLRWRLVMVDL